ncbi:MAG: hypothetical protein ACRENP_13705 [Longimicrobiales bacterium]
MSALRLTQLVLRERSHRILGLIGFAILFIAAGLAARVLTGPAGHVEMGSLMQVGGYPLVSLLLLLGWVLGRYPIIAALVLMAGIFSTDREAGYARLYAVRPVSFLRIYGLRFITLLTIAFLLSATLLPIFDVIMLGQWAGPNTLVLIACYVAVYGSLVAFLSVFIKGEGWVALALAVVAMIWEALRRGNVLAEAPPGVREVVSFLLPPQGPLFRIETAFAELQPVPWAAVGYVMGYSFVLLVAAAVFVVDREV